MTFKEQEEFWFNEYVGALGRLSTPYCTGEYKQKTSEFAAVCQAQHLIFGVLADKAKA